MGLKGKRKCEVMETIYDVLLYDANRERGLEYWNSEALVAAFITDEDVVDLLPEDLETYTDPPQGAMWFGTYGNSTLGVYSEFISLILVNDLHGKMGYYVPYIYVTNDAALAAGRELVGAHKKLADIKLENTEVDLIRATLDRPRGTRLITMLFKPVERAVSDVIDMYLPYPVPMLTVRPLPWLKNKDDGRTQLVSWHAEIDYHKDPKGEKRIWTGPVSINYDSPSALDPVHKLKVKEILAGLYFHFDMKLNVDEIQKEYQQL